MKKIEKVLIVMSVLSLIMMFNLSTGSASLLMISLSILAVVYFPLGFLLFSGVGIRGLFKGELKSRSGSVIVTAVVTGLGLSILCFGILFRFLHFPGGNEMLMIGSALSLLVLVIVVIRHFRSASSLDSFIIPRLAVFLVLGIGLFMTSSRTILKFQFRDHPAYVDAYLKYQESPTLENEIIRDREYQRMMLSPEDFETNEKQNGAN